MTRNDCVMSIDVIFVSNYDMLRVMYYRDPIRKLLDAVYLDSTINHVQAAAVLEMGSQVFIFLSIARFILGVGVGGVYPLAATVAAEGSSSERPGTNQHVRVKKRL